MSGILVYSVSNFVIFLVLSISPVCALLAAHLSTSFFFFSDHNWYLIFNFSFHMFIAAAAAAAKSPQSCPTLCDPIDSSPSGSSVPGILQARIPEWVAISFSNA